MKDQHPVNQIQTLRKVYDFIVRVTKIPFEGEPLQGLQVMGLLETRTLDFDRVILLSANEGTLPATSFGNSFIPVDIQREFGLPVVQEKNAVFAYHFYRLLQRAKEIHLVYNTEPDELGGGEPSRFIQQLLHELQKYQPAHEIQKTILSFPVPVIAGEQEITISKDETVYAGLMKKAQSGLSPTSLNRYKSCPLRFYFYDIAGIQLPDEVEETLEMQSIGSIVHKSLEILYKPYLQKKVSVADIDKMEREAEGAIATAFAEEYPGGDISFGRNRLISEVIKNFVKKFLGSEKAFLENISHSGQSLTILGLEEKLAGEIILDDPEKTAVKLKGIIDRVDSLDGLVRIIDYKTGRVEKNEFHFPSFEHFVASDKNDKSFQVLIYAWLYQHRSKQSEPRFKSGIISMRSLSGGLFAFAIKESRTAEPDDIIDRQKLMKFEEMLKDVLSELFDRSIPFAQTTNTDICKNCDFKDICVRG
jgi:ATP-dependent helicase/nuclease subunit B